MPNKIAIVLSGCGFLDGTEITEAVSSLIHLSRIGADVDCFAPDAPQTEIVNHATHKPAPAGTPPRNIMAEAARISRGRISPLASLKADSYEALVFPGGFGVAKNLCNFAFKGPECDILPDVERVLKQFHAARKPIVLICIAPALAARAFGKRGGGLGASVTIGTDPGTASAIAAMGSTNIAKGVREICFDEGNRLITTPAYMFDARPHEVFEGIGRAIDKLGTLLPVG